MKARINGKFVKGRGGMSGRKHSEKTKKKMSLAQKDNRYAFKKGRIPYNKGLKMSETQKRKISESCMGRISPMKGKYLSKETKRKIGKANKKKVWTEQEKKRLSEAQLKRWSKVEKKVYKRYIHIRDERLVTWRMIVFKRDGYTCRECGRAGCYLEAHHIKSWAKYPKLRYEVFNGIALCSDCHNHTSNELKLKCLKYQ